MALSLILDHEQTRMTREFLFATANGRELAGSLDGAPFTNTWLDPITSTLMLAPSCIESAWDTSNSGDYAKLGLSAFTLGTVGNWEERQDQRGKGPWLSVKDTAVSDTAITTATYAKNRGWCVSWFGYGSGERFVALRCGWNNTASASSGLSGRVTVQVFSDGAVVVYRGSTIVGEGTITGSATPDAQAGQFFKMLLLPFRHRELLVYGFKGSGFSVEFTDIASDDTNPTIVPGTNFWFEVPSGGTQVQLAPVRFPTTGDCFTQVLSFALPPATGQALALFGNIGWIQSQAPSGNKNFRVWGHPAYVGTQTAVCSLYEDDAATAFVANGTRQACRVKIDLTTSDAGYSPFVYGVAMAYSGARGTTNGTEEYDATSHVLNCELSVPDDAGGVQAACTVNFLETLETNVAKFRRLSNRPAKIELGANLIIDGYGDPDRYEIIHNPEAARMGFVVRDPWRVLDSYMFPDRMALDGLNFAEAIKQIVTVGLGGAPTWDVSTTTFAIALDPLPDSNDFSVIAEAGDTAGDLIHRLMRDYAATWVYGFRPTAAGVVFYAKDPADLPATPARTLYTTRAAATTAGKPDDVCILLHPEILEPEGTDVRVTGLDARSGRPIQAFKRNATLEDITTAPSLRPDGWLGEKRRIGAIIPEIKTPEELAYVTGLIYDRTVRERELVEWESDLLLYEAPHADEGYPLWRGERVEIDGHGEYRIISFGVRFLLEEGTPVRRATYVGEKL